MMNKAIQYIKKNEHTGQIKFVYLYEHLDDIPEELEVNHRMLDEVYPKIQIDLVTIVYIKTNRDNTKPLFRFLSKENSTLLLLMLSRDSWIYQRHRCLWPVLDQT